MDLLLIDDDEVDRTAVIRALRQSKLAFNVIEANCAFDGLNLALERHFDGILLDYMLPDANGLEVLIKLNAMTQDQTVVVMLSRYEDEKLAQRCIELGAQDFLLKDEVNSRILTRAIRYAKQRASMALALRNSHQKLKELAEHDSLTKLVNRYGFELCLNRAIARAKRSNNYLAVILLDLDDFKAINDTLGHQTGDILLVKVASRLSEVLRDGDVIARLGGDEFVVLVTDDDYKYFPMIVANRLLKAFEEVFCLGDNDVLIGASIGVAFYNEAASDSSELMKCADIAMYRAKKMGRNQIQFYSEALDREVRYRNHIESSLRVALRQNEFKVYYQAQVDSLTHQMVGMEALIRWQHLKDGVIAPDQFLPIAEEMGLMEEIGDWVLAEACRQAQIWLTQLKPIGRDFTIAVNLSASQIAQIDLLSKIIQTLELTGLPPTALELEITENCLIEDPHEHAKVLDQIAKLGVRFALDDFGTGFSSLEHIKLFPISVLKIDKSFIASYDKDEKDTRLLAALLNFAYGFNVISVAEGVETLEQAEFCTARNCNILQGYLFSRPLEAIDFEAKFITPLLTKL
ncbi:MULTISPECIES: putative bifunctional diguanylate cyclase/phosphodiesterase [Shewanella]|uniref:Response regulator receiver modulated diguanylate cyclase/phosphodiesterase n=1 Tax=Shewanella putrefaciens (strain CN-32 / ATCC BAA-453) TaxID=319224 RepID=A4YAQ7_SHEPC|nr:MULTISPECIES: GGDEF domain-containing response regulator [Shewanella]CAD6366440.1 Chemotaxis response regulator protein-glutamate methylesterase [Shewanella hafniensis]ABM23464.1 response regulator receiver modulated diguanylate cyclase/phosphodiesterase [Shewanella sp. W3-18-1]MCK7630751.1 EAL domain-containing protein [Shewanella sp. JNE9-1]MCK7635364.1 EAL domain-containing protein [Shewanella sp. JNE17]MCK7646019.1 EAL domain-containing protein [Shewanella sp. JNE3-1]